MNAHRISRLAHIFRSAASEKEELEDWLMEEDEEDPHPYDIDEELPEGWTEEMELKALLGKDPYED